MIIRCRGLKNNCVIGVPIQEAINTNYFDVFEREVIRNESYRHCSSY